MKLYYSVRKLTNKLEDICPSANLYVEEAADLKELDCSCRLM
jgi:hypothetical protein